MTFINEQGLHFYSLTNATGNPHRAMSYQSMIQGSRVEHVKRKYDPYHSYEKNAIDDSVLI